MLSATGAVLHLDRQPQALADAGQALDALSATFAQDLARLAAEGLSTFTISPDMAEQLLAVEATLAAAAQFELDASG